MKIGFYIKWNKFSLSSKGNVIGDELWGEALCRSINKMYKSGTAELYAPNYLPKEKLDIMIYLNDTEPIENYAQKHVLYLQNGYGEEAEKLLKNLIKNNYEGYIFFSKKLQKIFHEICNDTKSLYLPFGADTDLFYPREKKREYDFDCAYVGNDIKGEEATMKYIYPAVEYNFGLFGNWEVKKHKIKFWKNFSRKPIYKKIFERISRGKIPQEELPFLYSSAKINLNCTLPICIEWDVITLRTYEILACRGFLISDIVPSAFEQMRECMVFTTGGDDLREKIKYYLNHEDERKRIADNGYEYVLNNASISARAKQLIQYLEGIQ